MKYLVSAYWSGSLNINQMRLFDDLSAAQAYRGTLNDNLTFTRVYEVSESEPPKLIKP